MKCNGMNPKKSEWNGMRWNSREQKRKESKEMEQNRNE